MPDTILSPGDPAVPRDTSRRVSEQGGGAKRRKSPAEAAPPLATLARAQRSPYGQLARAERLGPRWRDIEWFDFTSDPDSAEAAAPDRGGDEPPRPAASELRNVLRRFAGSTPAGPPAGGAAIPNLPRRFARIPVQLSLPLRVPSPSAIPQLAAPSKPGSEPKPGSKPGSTPKSGRTVPQPRRPGPKGAAAEAVAAPRSAVVGEPPPEPAQSAPPPPAALRAAAPAGQPAVASRDEDRAFPASIFTPAATRPAAAQPAPSLGATLAARLNRVGAGVRGRSEIAAATVAARLNRVGGGVRGRSEGAAAALAGGVVRAKAALQARRSRGATQPLPQTHPQPQPGLPVEPRQASPETGPAADRVVAAEPKRRTRLPPAPAAGIAAGWTRRIAAMEPRMRVSGLLVLTALVIAIAAYLVGVYIAGLAETGADGGKRQAAAANPPARTAQAAAPAAIPGAAAPVQPAPPKAPESDPVARVTAPAAPVPPKTPPSEPVARAAFYLAKAKAGDPGAQYDVGVLYAGGDGLVQDYASAASWFHASAAQGNVAAEYNLGVMYANGLGVEPNDTQALNWYRSAADQDHPAAQFNLALAYAEGRGVRQDYAAASRWYLRAAKHGVASAMLNLALLYERGDGVERSPIDAYAWYSAAGERGDAAAKDRAGELFKVFNEREKARAEGLAATIGAALDSRVPPA